MTKTTALSSDPRPAFAECADVARSVLDQLTPEHASRDTPTDMTVGALVPHMVMAMRRAACSGRDIPLDQWPSDADDGALQTTGADLDRVLDDAIDAWRDDAALRAPRPLPWDPTTDGNESLALYVSELLLHTWDLSTAIGAVATWTDEALNTALAVLQKQLPIPDRAPIWEQVAREWGVEPHQVTAFANAVAIADGAPLLDRLLAWSGRDPHRT